MPEIPDESGSEPETNRPSPDEPESASSIADAIDGVFLKVHLDGAPTYEIGDEIWQTGMADAIRDQAEAIAEHLPEADPPRSREEEVGALVVAMSAALQAIGDTYVAPDGVQYSLVPEAPAGDTRPVIEDVVFEALPVGQSGSRRAIARWSDGSQSEVVRWYDDEILICEGDLIGKSSDQVRALHFRRDKDWLES